MQELSCRSRHKHSTRTLIKFPVNTYGLSNSTIILLNHAELNSQKRHITLSRRRYIIRISVLSPELSSLYHSHFPSLPARIFFSRFTRSYNMLLMSSRQTKNTSILISLFFSWGQLNVVYDQTNSVSSKMQHPKTGKEKTNSRIRS